MKIIEKILSVFMKYNMKQKLNLFENYMQRLEILKLLEYYEY